MTSSLNGELWNKEHKTLEFFFLACFARPYGTEIFDRAYLKPSVLAGFLYRVYVLLWFFPLAL